MKKVLLALCFICLNFITKSQSVPAPEFSLTPYYLNTDNTLKNLEKNDAQLDAKNKIVGGVDYYFTLNKAKSDIRFPKGTLPKFYIKVDANTDPSDVISLFIPEIKKDQRKFLLGSMGSFYKKAKDVNKYAVKIDFKKIADGVYEIIIPADLASGEYGFLPANINATNTSRVKVNCFGVD